MPTESVLRLDAESVLLCLEQLLVDGDLHVQGSLHLHQVLVLLHLLLDLLQRLLDLVIFVAKLLTLNVDMCEQEIFNH